MTRFLCTLLALMLAVGLIGLNAEEGGKPAKAKKTTGEIVQVDEGSFVVRVTAKAKKPKDGEEAQEATSTDLTFTTTDTTTIMVNGAEGELEVGQHAVVSHDAQNVASAIVVGKAPKEKKEKKPKDDEGDEGHGDEGGDEAME